MTSNRLGLPPSLHLALVNPHAGGGRAARLAAPLAQALAQAAPGCPLHVAQSIDDALAQLRALPIASRVLVVGGDGTLNRLLPAFLECGHALALVPCGTGNDTARALGLFGRPWQAALDAALTGKARLVDVGQAAFNGAVVHFVSSFSAGFDAAVCRRALEGPRYLTGLARYLRATLAEVATLRLWDLDISLDGVPVHAGPALFAATLNTPTFGSGMPAVPHARIDDARLDFLLAGAFGRAGVLAMLPRLMVGRHLGDGRVLTRPYTALSIRSRDALPMAADGEYLGESLAIELRVLPAALTVIGA